ncbi:hypothetical protein [Aliivibrio fischeri]|uniref:hypothetical protein n=1 Tax=Aliivibrio fischeri TaxID=668 RepID=UPI00080DC429|nr:hypothetical protein [Aliivibrio fischeri]OCH03201.1 hypothetical protein A6E10_15785 [Aliivibrio fischeri]
MKKGLLGVIAVGLFVFIATNMNNTERVPLNMPLPDNPSFNISNDFDGDWSGKRIDISGDGICRQTSVVGTIQEGKVSLRLVYNNTTLKGWISDNGELALYADSQKWGYRFTGLARNNRIEGEWKVTNAPCRGTWFIEKQ